jgi:mevalonate pyrophosphate decarboxylase
MHLQLTLRRCANTQQNSRGAAGKAAAAAAAAAAVAAEDAELDEVHDVEVWPQLRRNTARLNTAAAAAAAVFGGSSQAKPLQLAERHRYAQ